MLFSNVELEYRLNLKLEYLLLKLLLKLVLRRRKRSDCGVSSETLGYLFTKIIEKTLIEKRKFKCLILQLIKL